LKQDNLIINDQPYTWPQKYITGEEIRRLGNIKDDTTLYYKVQGKDEEIHDHETVDLGRIGIEHFYSVDNHPKFSFTLNKVAHEWKKQTISGMELRALGSIPETDHVFLKEEDEDLLVNDHDRIDLAPLGAEEFYSKPPHKQKVKITVTVKGKTKVVELEPGTYQVSVIKQLGDCPAAFELEQKINGTLTPLDDNASVVIKGGEEFVGHVRDGSSS
jgi:Multiubiquitin